MAFFDLSFSFFTTTPFLPGLWLACLLDVLLGDPRFIPHPVVLIARVATGFEHFFLQKDISETSAGRCTVIATILSVGLAVSGLFFLLSFLAPWVLIAGSIYLLYTTFALRSLSSHAMAVYSALKQGNSSGNLELARQSVGLIVGRSTKNLDEAGIVRACVESVAENMSDGVVAPLFFALAGALWCLFIGYGELGLPMAALSALLYKTVNTMDSMFGYTNQKYLNFGRCAALLDDAVNFLPARLTAVLLVFGAFLTQKNGKRAWVILSRDRHQHASPNAGYPEAAMAGALGLQLGGKNIYFGKIIAKPTIGDASIRPKPVHIKNAVWVMITSSLLLLLCLSLLYFIFLKFYFISLI